MQLTSRIVALEGNNHLLAKTSEKLKIKHSTLTATLFALKNKLCESVVAGIPDVTRTVRRNKDNEYDLLVQGKGLSEVMATPGVNWKSVTCNHSLEIQQVLGIEAVRSSIIDEIIRITENYGISIDMRHLMLLAYLMTFKGRVLGITRQGLKNMKQSVFMLASFEKTVDHLFSSAVHARSDGIAGVSECTHESWNRPLQYFIRHIPDHRKARGNLYPTRAALRCRTLP